ARPGSAAAVDRALVRREEQRHVVVVATRLEHDRRLDLLEEAAVDVEDEPVLARSKGLSLGQIGNAAVLVRLLKRDQLLSAEEPYLDARAGPAQLGVEDMGRDHVRNLPWPARRLRAPRGSDRLEPVTAVAPAAATGRGARGRSRPRPPVRGGRRG